MDGEIGVDSEVGKGSRFWFKVRLPRNAQTVEVSTRPFKLFDQNQYFTGHALVVDDVIINQVVAIKMLEKLGLTAVAASSGQEALAMLQNEHFDLVFMDCHMPELDGYETARLVRTSSITRANEIPIIAITASAMQGDMDKCLQAGMNGYISKPVNPQQLAGVVAQWTPAHQPGSVSHPSTSRPIVDQSIMEQLRSLAPSPDHDGFIAGMFQSFALMISPSLAIMRAALTAGDAKALRSEAHKIKSVGAALGAARFAAACQALEGTPASAPAEITPLIEQVSLEFTLFASALEQVINLNTRRHPA